MKTIWTDHLKDPDEKVQFEKSLKHSNWILEHLSTILGRMESSLDKQELSTKAYDSPNWSYRQADSNGFRRCLKMIKDIITLDQEGASYDPR